MSVWRQKAIDIAPELKKDFEDPDLSPYTVFSELLYLLQQAHVANDKKRIQKIYDYAEWCSKQKEQKLWNAAGGTQKAKMIHCFCCSPVALFVLFTASLLLPCCSFGAPMLLPV